MNGNSGRTFTPLSINGNQGFPQTFPVAFGGGTYQFSLYVNIATGLVADQSAIYELPYVEAASQQILTLAGFLNGDQFKLSFGGKSTAAIPYSSVAATQAASINNALNQNNFLGAGNRASVTPIAIADAYQITFGGGLLDNVLPITGSAVATTTTTTTATAHPAGMIASAAVRNLDSPQAYLVVRVDQDMPDGSSVLLFLRKVVPELEYEAGTIALIFPTQSVAVQNLNGQGSFGSQVTGGIAPRWA